MSSRRALVTGIGGQDGSYLTEQLLALDYEVYGFDRQPPPERLENLAGVRDRIELIEVDLLDESSFAGALERHRPHEVYNLAAISFVPMSWQQPVLTAELAAVGVTAMLEAIRKTDPAIRFFQASSSEIFGEPTESPQNELTPLDPLTPYGVGKAYGHLITRSYRRRYGLFACSGILYNHESPRRPYDFVTRKVAHAAAAISLGLEGELTLGDLDARRDWGYAADFTRAMWLMLDAAEADDYVIATGEPHSVRDLVACAFSGLDLDWNQYVRIDEALQRDGAGRYEPVGDPAKARRALGWEPSVGFEELVRLLVDSELTQLRDGSPIPELPQED